MDFFQFAYFQKESTIKKVNLLRKFTLRDSLRELEYMEHFASQIYFSLRELEYMEHFASQIYFSLRELEYMEHNPKT